MQLEYAYGFDDVVVQFVASLIPQVRERGFSRASKAIGVVSADQLIGGIVYHNWNPEAGIIEMSVAALPGCRWLSRETVRRMFEYPFQQLNCQMVINIMDAENEPLLRQCASLGFNLIRLPRLMGREKDAVFGYLTEETWRANKIHRRVEFSETPQLSEAA
jgi:RimJ/RimL family protein N-acetyltransferase